MRPDDWYIYYDKSSFVGCNPVELGKAAADRIERDGKQLSYLQQENEVLIERIRLLEIALAAEREACAKVAEEYGSKLAGDDDAFTKWQSEFAVSAANSIASLIRGRGEK